MTSIDLYSICNFVGLNESGSCGYCDGKKDGPKHTVSGYFYRVKSGFYEKLLCKQWRRCGKYYYQPQNSKTCCPQYTIRINAFDFKLTSPHRRVERKVEHWLKTGERKLPPLSNSRKKVKSKKKDNQKKPKTLYPAIDKIITDSIHQLIKAEKIPVVPSFMVNTQENRKMKGIDVEKYQVSSSVVFQLLGILKKVQNKKDVPTREELGNLISEECMKSRHLQEEIFTEMKAHSSGFLHISVKPETFKQVKSSAYEENVVVVEEEEEKEKDDRKVKKKDKIEEAIDTELHPAEFRKEEYLLYKSYQMKIHHDEAEDISERGYKRFLCESSLIREKNNNDENSRPQLPLKGYGTFHLAYRLRKSKKLIGVSVLDVLPGGISSVYFFYDIKYQFLDLGKYSVLHELQNLYYDDREKKTTLFPDFKNYYLGFYIHDCIKMRYKSQYKPQQIVCNVTWKWVDLRKAKKVLDKSSFGRFYDEKSEESEESEGEEEEEGKKKKEEEEEEEEEVSEERLKNTLIYYKGDLVRKEIFKGVFGSEIKNSVVEKMKKFHLTLGEWTSNVAFYIDEDDIEKGTGLESLYQMIRKMQQQQQ